LKSQASYRSEITTAFKPNSKLWQSSCHQQAFECEKQGNSDFRDGKKPSEMQWDVEQITPERTIQQSSEF
jgi:hypothetical protein